MATTTSVNYTFGVANGDEIKIGFPVQLTANEVRANVAELDTQGVTWDHVYAADALNVDVREDDDGSQLEKLKITGVTGAEIVATTETEFGDFPYYPAIE